jgi:hypothetical protein
VAACYLGEIFTIRKNFANLPSINSFEIASNCNESINKLVAKVGD